MASFGDNLKREREARGISLQEISEHTRIGVAQLKAIEDEQLDHLPGGIFNKSFVRQYARYLGLDEDQVIAEYLQTLGAAPEAPAAAANVSPEKMSLPAGAGYPRLILTAVCLGIAVAAIFYAIHHFTERPTSPGSPATPASAESTNASRETPHTPADQPAPGNPPEANPVPSLNQLPGPAIQIPPEKGLAASAAPAALAAGGGEVPASGGAAGSLTRPNPPLAAAGAAEKPRGETGAADAAAGGLLLQIDARKEVWLSITADGQKQWQGILPADRTRRVQARESVRLTVGDAGAVALTLNGRALPPVGRPGEVKNLNISAKGLAEPAP